MATQPRQAETHQQSQEAIAAAMVPLLGQAWGLVDFQNLQESIPRFRAALQAIIDRYGRAAAAASLLHFHIARASAGVPGRVTVPATTTPPEGFVDQMIVETVAQGITQTPADGLDSLDARAEQLVLDQGRRQMMSAAAIDREAKGWARVVNPGACSFCLMLALRGPVYRSRAIADFRAHYRQPNGSGGDCKCSVEPVFGHWEPQASVREAQRVWADATKGRSGHDARVAFRQAVEGRKVTGARDKRTTNKRGEKFTQAQGRTPENQRAQLRVLEAMPPAKTPEAAAWRISRIAEIRKYLGD